MTPLAPRDSLEGLCFWGNDRVAAGGWDGQLRVWSLPDGACVATYGEALPKATGLVISSSRSGAKGVAVWGDRLVSFRGGVLRIHDGEAYDGTPAPWREGLYRAGLTPHEWGTRPNGDYVALHPDGLHLAEAGMNSNANVWDLTDGNCVQTVRTAGPIALHPSGRYLAGRSGVFQVYTGERVLELDLDSPLSLTFTPDGHSLVVGSWHSVRLYDLASGQAGAELPTEFGGVNALAWHPQGWLVGAGNQGGLEVWDLGKAELVGKCAQQGQWRAVDVSPDGRRVAWGGSAGAFWKPWEEFVA